MERGGGVLDFGKLAIESRRRAERHLQISHRSDHSRAACHVADRRQWRLGGGAIASLLLLHNFFGWRRHVDASGARLDEADAAVVDAAYS